MSLRSNGRWRVSVMFVREDTSGWSAGGGSVSRWINCACGVDIWVCGCYDVWMPKGVTKIPKVISSGSVPRKTGSGAVQAAGATTRLRGELGRAGVKTVMEGLGEAGEQIKVAMLQKLSETDGELDPKATVGLDVEKHIIMEQIGGRTPVEIAREYGVHRNFVNNALRRRFGSKEKGKEALMNLMLENALALQESVATRIGEFSGPQAVLASAIMADKMMALEKSIAETPKTIDFSALRNIGETLKRLRDKVPGVKTQPST